MKPEPNTLFVDRASETSERLVLCGLVTKFPCVELQGEFGVVLIGNRSFILLKVLGI